MGNLDTPLLGWERNRRFSEASVTSICSDYSMSDTVEYSLDAAHTFGPDFELSIEVLSIGNYIGTSMHKINVGLSVYYKVSEKFTCGLFKLFFLSRTSVFFLSLAILLKLFFYELS